MLYGKNPYTSVEIKDLPEGLKKGDILFQCGCVCRDNKLWYRHQDCKYHNPELKMNICN